MGASDQLVEHELAFVKVRATDQNRAEIIKVVELYKGRVVDIAPESVIVEATGTEKEIDALVALLRSYGIKELVRTGAVVMLRGAGSIEEQLKWEGNPPAEGPRELSSAVGGPIAKESGRR